MLKSPNGHPPWLFTKQRRLCPKSTTKGKGNPSQRAKNSYKLPHKTAAIAEKVSTILVAAPQKQKQRRKVDFQRSRGTLFPRPRVFFCSLTPSQIHRSQWECEIAYILFCMTQSYNLPGAKNIISLPSCEKYQSAKPQRFIAKTNDK